MSAEEIFIVASLGCLCVLYIRSAYTLAKQLIARYHWPIGPWALLGAVTGFVLSLIPVIGIFTR